MYFDYSKQLPSDMKVTQKDKMAFNQNCKRRNPKKEKKHTQKHLKGIRLN